ncbi:hypothetical protein CBP36_17435 [Acidovorax carolinensis]|uniref:Uncharacterized protein n=1 Tax=Acidovorax carolinensis TaxID=553814 RepID=A0A240UIS6_9BURK|nr:hypothetical protein CBP35_01480 [Acidovorax carolinensis]ART61026.1 hypothetical protein CBP36_17435 [Acidovorax carolinensis]
MPVTFGQPFKAGDWLHTTQGLVAQVGGATIPLQADEISSHRDGSARFAVLSAQLSNVQPGEARIINIFPGAKVNSTPSVPASPDWNLELEAQVYDANGNVTATLVAQPQSQLVTQIASTTGRRLAGAVATEYTVALPFKNKATGTPHPHLSARLHTRLTDGGQRIRTDVVMENTRTWTASPGNITYSFAVKRNGSTIYTQPKFTHYHHARWHKVLWTGALAEPQARVRHNMPYFMASKAVWNYDLNLKISDTELSNSLAYLKTKQQEQAALGPMANLFLTPYFPTTGGRSEIGPFPKWTASYLISQDDRALQIMLAHGDAAGAVPVHYRDESTGQVLDLDRYPKVTVLVGTSEPSLPNLTPNSTTIWTPDTAHQPSLAFVPYLITGDAFYQDEVTFWAGWNLAAMDPQYRGYGTGLLTQDQIRGQAWNMRALSEAVRITPDSHVLKGYFKTRMTNNMNWYKQRFVENASSESPLGAVQKPDENHLTAPWQDDFLGVTFGQLVDDGEPHALPVLNFFSKFNVGRFLNEGNGFCIAKAPGYYWNIRDANGVFIKNWDSLFTKNFPGTSCTADLPIDGYPEAPDGSAAFARAMLGSAASAGIPNAASAYNLWVSKTPRMDAAFTADPTWAITPRI